ncbi:MAG: hypothetical protein Q8753_00220 [Pigeon pea little leaf phytoplasma]|nr:hypothetical protein [Pigeon pea little leaf phytoplasma]
MNKLWENISYILISCFVTTSVFLIGIIVFNYDEINNYNKLHNNSRIIEKNPNNKFNKIGLQNSNPASSNSIFQHDDPSVLENGESQKQNNPQEDPEPTIPSFPVATSKKLNSDSSENEESQKQNNPQEDSEPTIPSFPISISQKLNSDSSEDEESRDKIAALNQRHFYNPEFSEYIRKILNGESVEWRNIKNLHPEDLFSFFKEEPNKFFNEHQRKMIIKDYLSDSNIRRLLKEYIRHSYINFKELFAFGFTWEQLAFYFDFQTVDFAKYIEQILEGKKLVWRSIPNTVQSHDLLVFFDEEPNKFFTQEQRNLIIKSYLTNIDVREVLKWYIKEDPQRISRLFRFGFSEKDLKKNKILS